MSMVTTSDGTRLFYRHWGARDGQAIVFHRGWPLSADEREPASIAEPVVGV